MGTSGKKARGKHRLDKYYHLAKEQGFRSRAAFKLVQLNKKHGFLNDARAVLDLCAAPGGWLQVCVKHMPLSSRIIGVDLDTIKPVRGVTTLVDDITTQQCRDRLRKESGGSLFDVVLHDGAPNVGGAFASESYSQSALVLDACKLACEFLRPKGTFVTKVFRSRDYTALLFAFRQLFHRVDATKPQASRNTSAEIFVVCMGYKAPGKVDPRLLDHRVLFADVQETPKVMGPDALLKTVAKKQRHRTGYEDNVSMMHSPEEDDMRMEPAEMAELIRSSDSTTSDVRALCKDLQVLGRSEFQALLKWRLKVKKAIDARLKEMKKAVEQDVSEGEDDGDKADNELTAEEKFVQEMEDLRAKIEKGAKKHRKKRREVKKKAKLRLASMALTSGIGEQLDPEEEKLFSLETIKGARALESAAEVSALDEDEVDETLGTLDSDEEMASSVDDDSDADSDDDRLRYETMVEDYIDAAYQNYLDRKSLRAAKEVEQRKRKRMGDEGEVAGEDAAGELGALPEARGDSESEEEEEAGGGLLTDLAEDKSGVRKRKTGRAIAQQWFGQDAFQDEDLLEDEPITTHPRKRGHEKAFPIGGEDDSDDEDDVATRPAQSRSEPSLGHGDDRSVKPSHHPGRKGAEAEREQARQSNDSDDDEATAIGIMKGSASRKAVAASRRATEKAELDIVPMENPRDGESDSTDTEGEFEAMDNAAKAEIRAMARKWMSSRKNQLSLLDAAYNRYTFSDSGLPKWFCDDEARHMRPMTTVTRQEIEAERELLRAIDARPMKKIAEAKARKKRKVAAKMTEARGKAEAIVDNEDMSVDRKAREINKLYSRAKAHGRDKKSAPKSRKMSRSQREKSSKSGPPLDRRMIADKMKGKARKLTQAKRKGTQQKKR